MPEDKIEEPIGAEKPEDFVAEETGEDQESLAEINGRNWLDKIKARLNESGRVLIPEDKRGAGETPERSIWDYCDAFLVGSAFWAATVEAVYAFQHKPFVDQSPGSTGVIFGLLGLRLLANVAQNKLSHRSKEDNLHQS